MGHLRIDGDIFERLLFCMREHQDPENMSIELVDDTGDLLLYEDGVLTIVHGTTFVTVKIDQLIREQRNAIEAVLIEQINRIVANIIEEVLDVD